MTGVTSTWQRRVWVGLGYKMWTQQSPKCQWGLAQLTTKAIMIRALVWGLIACLLSACDQHTTDSKTENDEQQRATTEAVVHVYNWSDYIAPEVLASFEQETGIKVVYDVFDSNELLETKLLAGGSGYDIVVPTAIFLQRQIQAGVFQPLQRQRLPHWDQQWPAIMQRTAHFDPANEHAINYMWGTTGFGYNTKMLAQRLPDVAVDSWALIFTPEYMQALADCGVYFLDAPEEMLPAALKHLGIAPDSQDPAHLAQAEALLESVRPYVRKFHSSEYINALANGDICLAVGWSGDVLQARERAKEAGQGVDIAYAVPQEGTRMWFDMMAIPQDAPHPENAHAFIDYLLRPEVIAQISNTIYFANGNLGAQQFLSEDVISDPLIYPSEAVVSQLFTVRAYEAEAQRLVNRLWMRIKSDRASNH